VVPFIDEINPPVPEPEPEPAAEAIPEPHTLEPMLSKEAANEWGREHYPAPDEVEPELLESVTRFVGPAYQWINKYLRNDTLPFDIDETRSDIDNLDALTKANPLPETIVAYRGVEVQAFGGEPYSTELPDDIDGEVFEDPGFLSTSVDPNPTRQFSSSTVQLRLTVPKGTPSYYVPNLGHRNADEMELLLGRGRKIQVIDKERGDGEILRSDQWYVDAIILPEEDEPSAV
jgi:hypothetical protein